MKSISRRALGVKVKPFAPPTHGIRKSKLRINLQKKLAAAVCMAKFIYLTSTGTLTFEQLYNTLLL